MKIAVLGAGRVGRAMALDLARDPEFEVTVVDHAPEALMALDGAQNISTEQADLSNPGAVRKVMKDQDLGVGAVPGFMGFQTLQAILEAGRPAVDIAFFPEDPFLLDGLARAQGLVAIVDAGIAPGCSNLILGRLEEEMEETTRFECLVGGLPVIRHWPFQYKAPFSPLDVIEEYTRPARLRRNGKTVTVPALSELETHDFPDLGALEAFNTDGLRTLLRTAETPEMVEKTMRYPGHAEWMRGLRAAGFFETRPMEIGDTQVSPKDVTARLLDRVWSFDEGEEDLTIMRVRVDGIREGQKERHTFHLLDRYDTENQTSSMARTTGYTCTAMVRMVARNLYSEPGISPPELVGQDPTCYEFVMAELAARGIRFEVEVENLGE
jgi:saccharopine dehydrogenase-like NADP-dependent oxidoreductase